MSKIEKHLKKNSSVVFGRLIHVIFPTFYITENEKTRRTYRVMIIDDYSRLIVGGRISEEEETPGNTTGVTLFRVRSFKQMIDSGLDMYVASPILSMYLGHKTIYSTERYVRLTMSLYPYIEECFKDKMDKVLLFFEWLQEKRQNGISTRNQRQVAINRGTHKRIR